MAGSKSRRGPGAVASVLAAAGALAVLLGTQRPAVGVGGLTTLTVMQLDSTAGWLLVGAASGALLAVLLGSRPLLGLCALALWAGCLWPAQGELREHLLPAERGPLEAWESHVEDSLQHMLIEDAAEVSSIEPGGWLIAAGCVLVSLAALARR